MHKTLERQLIRQFGSLANVPSECAPLIAIVAKTYSDYDAEYKLIERSLEISSAELTESNNNLRRENIEANDRAEKLAALNDMMIDREIKMVELKQEIKRLEAQIQKNSY